ncbi:MAG: NADH-quinone oxidoreductase subunit J [bacterium]
MSNLIFWGFVGLTLGSALVVVFHSRIIYSAFALLFTFFGVAALYLYLRAEFLAASQILVYVGGILTLIIFGVFLTARITSLEITQQTHQRLIALIPVGMIGFILMRMILLSQWQVGPLPTSHQVSALGKALLTDYFVPFELASVLLLTALVGAMRLARYYRRKG